MILNDENYMNSFSHVNVPDIRSVCPYRNCKSTDRCDEKHFKRYRHVRITKLIRVIP